jgi:hypothetical protein
MPWSPFATESKTLTPKSELQVLPPTSINMSMGIIINDIVDALCRKKSSKGEKFIKFKRLTYSK